MSNEFKKSAPVGSYITSKSLQVILLTILCDIVVITAYIWFISIGTWTNWPTIQYYNNYDELATAFRHGQISLESKPDPALVALANPYDPEQRKDIPYKNDVSLYKGKFYLYFGATPAVILAIVKTIIPGVIGDQYLVFAFISGIFLVGSLFILKIWRRFFSDIPPWKVVCGLLVIGLTGPYCWTLGIPVINNAAIMGGQFFFLAGLYTAFDALDRDTVPTVEMVITGVFWAAAVGARMAQALPVVFMTVMILIWIARKYRQAGRQSNSIPAVLTFGLTLALGAAIIGWYNWARFDSVFESGIMYQLTPIDLQKNRTILFTPLYIIQNLFNYFLNPPKLIYSFPWFRTVNGIQHSIITTFPLPRLYSSQQIVGLLYNVPFVLFAIIPISRILMRRPASPGREDDQRSFDWLIIALWGSCLSAAVLLWVYWISAGRFLGDFLPALLLLSVIGFWQLGRSVASRPALRVLYIFIAIALIMISLIISNLLALDINNTGFKALNPLLWRQLSNFFR